MYYSGQLSIIQETTLTRTTFVLRQLQQGHNEFLIRRGCNAIITTLTGVSYLGHGAHCEYSASANMTPVLREAMFSLCEHVPRRVCGHLLKPCKKHSFSGCLFVMYYIVRLYT